MIVVWFGLVWRQATRAGSVWPILMWVLTRRKTKMTQTHCTGECQQSGISSSTAFLWSSSWFVSTPILRMSSSLTLPTWTTSVGEILLLSNKKMVSTSTLSSWQPLDWGFWVFWWICFTPVVVKGFSFCKTNQTRNRKTKEKEEKERMKRRAILSFRTPGLEISTFSRKYLMAVFIGFRRWNSIFRSTTHPHPKDPSICFSLTQHILEFHLVW